MRRDLKQTAAFVQRFVNKRQFAVLEVAQSSMNQATRDGRCAAAHIVFLDDGDAEPAQRGIPRNAGAVDAGTDYGQIDVTRPPAHAGRT